MSLLNVNLYSRRGGYWAWQFHAVFFLRILCHYVRCGWVLLLEWGREPVVITGVDPGFTRNGAFLAPASSRTFGGV